MRLLQIAISQKNNGEFNLTEYREIKIFDEDFEI